MSENKTLYIDQLLDEIKSLYESVLERKNSGSLPFSFLEESFNRIQDIEGLLHKLEYMQVDDLKKQMERLVVVLSENERRVREAVMEKEKEQNENRELLKKMEQKELLAREQEVTYEKDEDIPQDDQQKLPDERDDRSSEVGDKESNKPESRFPHTLHRNKNAEGVVLPKYENPFKSKESQDKNRGAQFRVNKLSDDKKVNNITDYNNKSDRSVNDKIKTLPTVLDLYKGFSLNDKFLFQRELFGNSRQTMDSTIKKLSGFKTFEDVENYIKDNISSDLDDPTVADFLSIIKKGFK